MKKIFTYSLLLVTGSFAALAARADLLYFMVSAFDWDGPKNFDYATVGATDDGGKTATYLNIYSSPDMTGVETVIAGSDAERYTAVGWADVTGYTDASMEYTFFVETWADGEDDPIWGYSSEKALSYAQLFKDGHIYIPGETDAQDVTPWNVPEPSSGLLMLIGIAALGLRRKSKMKKFLTYSLFLVTFSSFGAANDTLISFSTKGPDKYLDGTIVKDGECYALVWTRNGATFGGIAADGKAAGDDSKVVVFAPVAKGGHCPPVMFELDAALSEQYQDGAFGVYLLDTRLAGGAVGGLDANGVPVAVNGFGEVMGNKEEGVSKAVAAVTQQSALPAGAPKPQITAIRVVGDKVLISVKGTLPCLQYKASEVALGSGAGGKEAVVSVEGSASAQGAATTEEEITVIAPKRGESGFFSVGRK